jgi:hypothetical protein
LAAAAELPCAGAVSRGFVAGAALQDRASILHVAAMPSRHDEIPVDLELLPRSYFGGGRVLPALVPACCVDMGLLASLKDRLADFGEEVAVQRMRYDRRYAFERIALAHGLSDPVLRRLALMLFEIYNG